MRLVFSGQKEFEASLLPELIFATGVGRQRWQDDVFQVACQCVVYADDIVLIAKPACDRDIWKVKRRKWNQ
jgi:hypothetical protein